MGHSMSDLNWDSPTQRQHEWAYANQRLNRSPNGTKLRRKDHPQIEHSFIVIDGKILAMAPRGEYIGRGSFGRAKLCEEEDGKLWAVKISALQKNNLNIQKIQQNEESIVNDLGLGLKAITRTPYFCFFGSKEPKHYLAMQYLGKSLLNVQTQDFSDLQRYDLALKMLGALKKLHSGSQSKIDRQYVHGDIALRNFTIDDHGTVHLIDFGLSRYPSTVELDIHSDLFYSDARRTIYLIRDLFLNPTTKGTIERELTVIINQTSQHLAESAQITNKNTINIDSGSLYTERMMDYITNKLEILSHNAPTVAEEISVTQTSENTPNRLR